MGAIQEIFLGMRDERIQKAAKLSMDSVTALREGELSKARQLHQDTQTLVDQMMSLEKLRGIVVTHLSEAGIDDPSVEELQSLLILPKPGVTGESTLHTPDLRQTNGLIHKDEVEEIVVAIGNQKAPVEIPVVSLAPQTPESLS